MFNENDYLRDVSSIGYMHLAVPLRSVADCRPIAYSFINTNNGSAIGLINSIF